MVKLDDYDPNRQYNEKQQLLGEKSFRYASTSKERIETTQKRNEILESSPTAIYTGKTYEDIMNLRPRDKDKEVGPPSLRFQAKSGLDRVQDVIIQRNNGIIP